MSVYPSPKISSAVVEPYNTVFNMNKSLESIDCSFVTDNEALYDICQEGLQIDRPHYTNLNRVLSRAYSSMTASLRFNGLLNVDLNEFQTNLVPYPRIHFPHIAYAPIVNNNRFTSRRTSAYEMTSACFRSSNQMAKLDVKNCRYRFVLTLNMQYFSSCCFSWKWKPTSPLSI